MNLFKISPVTRSCDVKLITDVSVNNRDVDRRSVGYTIGLSRVNFCNGYSFAHDDDSVDTAVILIEIVRDDYSIVATRAACLLSVFIIASLTR